MIENGTTFYSLNRIISDLSLPEILGIALYFTSIYSWFI